MDMILGFRLMLFPTSILKKFNDASTEYIRIAGTYIAFNVVVLLSLSKRELF